MRKKVEQNVYRISNMIEFFIALLIIVVIIMLAIDLSEFIIKNLRINGSSEIFTSFLEKALNLVIGIEFVKMLCNHKPETIIEVLLFAIARQMIVEHLGVVETFIGVASIAALFATQKFLFIKDKKE